MRVYVYPRPELESVGVAVGVNYGSIDDRKEISGAAHYLEHMLFKGTTKRSTQEIKQVIRDMGVTWNAFTTFETTLYYMQGYSGYFDEIMDVISDMTTNSTLPKGEFELERGPVINERLMHQDNPRYFFYDTLGKALYRRHPAMRPIGGSRETIEGTTRRDLLDIYKAYYTPRNMVIAIYGNVNGNRAKETVNRYFGKFSRRYRELKRPIADEPQVKRELVMKRENLNQARIGIGFKTLPYKKASVSELLSLMVISKMLSDRLFDEVRDRNGLSYDPSAGYYPFSTFSYFGAQAGVEAKKINEAKSIMLAEMGKMERGEITRREVERARSGLSIQYRMQRENALAMVNSIASYALVMHDYRLTEKLPEMLQGVSAEDVRRYCKRYIKTKNYSMAVLKPE